MKKNQERRLHRKNAKLVKEGGTPMQINRVVKADTTVSSCLMSRAVVVSSRTDRLSLRLSVVVGIVVKSVT